MTLRRIFIQILIAAAPVVASSQNNEIIELDNGATVIGYVKNQTADGTIGLTADTAVIVLPSNVIRHIEFLKKGSDAGNLVNIHLNTPGDSIEFLKNIYDKAGMNSSQKWKTNIMNVELLEEGSFVKFRDVTPSYIIVNGDDITYIEKRPRPQNQINGIIDEIVTKNGDVITGTIIGTVPGKSLKILTNEGRTYVVAQNDISVQRKKPLDPDIPIINQTPLIDFIYLNDSSVLKSAFVVEQNMNNGTFTYVDMANYKATKPLKNISRIEHARNLVYSPITLFNFNKDSVYVDSIAMQEISFNIKNDKIQFRLPKTEIRSFVERKTVIDMFDSPSNRDIYVVPLEAVEGSTVELSVNSLIFTKITEDEQIALKHQDFVRRVYRLTPGLYACLNYKTKKLVVFRIG